MKHFTLNMTFKYPPKMKFILNSDYTNLKNIIYEKQTIIPLTTVIAQLKAKYNPKIKNTTYNEEQLYKALNKCIISLAEFRVYYSRHIKPKQLKTKIKQNLLKNQDKNTQDFITHYYDIISRIEKALGKELYFNDSSLDYRIIDESVTRYYYYVHINQKLKIACKYVPLKSIKVSMNIVKYKNNYWLKHHTYAVKNSNDLTDFIPHTFTTKWKECNRCTKKYTIDYPFVYNKLIKTKVCKICNTELISYVQPSFTEENIFHSQYHSSRSNFKFIPCYNKNENQLHLGLELETELLFNTAEQRQTLLYVLWTALNKKDIVFEKDGSLNARGVECITNPMTLSYAKNYWNPIAANFLRTNTLGIRSGFINNKVDKDHAYWGIHLTSERAQWSNFEVAKLMNFMYNQENQTFLNFIFQRNMNYGSFEIGIPNTYNLKENHSKVYNKQFIINKVNKHKVTHTTRSTTINLTKPNFIEIRAFQTTNKVSEILKNMQFINALWNWLRSNNCNMTPLAKNFLDWVMNLDKNNRKTYQDLIKYIQHPTFEFLNIKKKELQILPNPFVKK